MKRKRIAHHADIFCDMFAGWRIFSDLDALINLRGGQFRLDILNNKITLDDNPYPDQIKIIDEISYWFDKDLNDYNIPKTEILQANLTAHFKIDVTEGKRKSRTRKIVTLELKMTSYIRTDAKE